MGVNLRYGPGRPTSTIMDWYDKQACHLPHPGDHGTAPTVGSIKHPYTATTSPVSGRPPVGVDRRRARRRCSLECERVVGPSVRDAMLAREGGGRSERRSVHTAAARTSLANSRMTSRCAACAPPVGAALLTGGARRGTEPPHDPRRRSQRVSSARGRSSSRWKTADDLTPELMLAKLTSDLARKDDPSPVVRLYLASAMPSGCQRPNSAGTSRRDLASARRGRTTTRTCR